MINCSLQYFTSKYMFVCIQTAAIHSFHTLAPTELHGHPDVARDGNDQETTNVALQIIQVQYKHLFMSIIIRFVHQCRCRTPKSSGWMCSSCTHGPVACARRLVGDRGDRSDAVLVAYLHSECLAIGQVTCTLIFLHHNHVLLECRLVNEYWCVMVFKQDVCGEAHGRLLCLKLHILTTYRKYIHTNKHCMS